MASVVFQDRAVGAVLGSFVADAAAVPLHWIYNQEKLDSILAGYGGCEFLDKNHCPFYNIATGSFSCYGDQAYCILEAMNEGDGYDEKKYKELLTTTFGADTDYDMEKKLGRPVKREDCPISGPWRSGSIKTFLKNIEDEAEKTGADDSQADCFSKVAPIVCLYAGTMGLEKKVEDVVRVTQDNDLAVAAAVAAALILEEYILQGPNASADCIRTVLPKISPLIRDDIQKALDAKDMSHKEAVKEFGLSCSLPGSLQGAVHCLVKSDGKFVSTVRSTIEAGGDNCARCCFVGACMGAKVGLREIPHKWVAETSRGLEVIQQAAQYMDMRKASYEATREALRAKQEEQQ